MPAAPDSDSRSRLSRYTLGAEGVLAALVALGPLAFGGAPLWVRWPLVGLSGLALALAAVGARRQGQSVHLPLLALPLGLGAALCLLQLLPLPAGLLAALSPEAAALRDFALVPLGLEGPRPLSLDPPSTWRALALYLGCLMAFVAAAQVCRSRRVRRRLLSALVATGMLVVALGLVHELLGLTRFLGLVSYDYGAPPLLTPFVNPNHLAAFLGLASTVALGLALSSERRVHAAAFALAAVLGGVGVLMSLSRGGIAFFAFGQLALALLVVRQRRVAQGGAPVWGRAGAVLLGLLAALAVGGYAAAERLAGEWAHTGGVEALRHSKVELWPMVAETARAFPLSGMGRGAFEAAFPRYQTRPLLNTLTHPENAVLQLGVEWGVPGLLLLALGMWGFVRLLRREQLGAAELAALAGVGALGLHDLFDFSLELPACAVAAWVALAAAARPEVRSQAEAPRGLPPLAVLTVGLLLTALGLAALVPGRHTLAEDEAELTALVSARAPLAEVRARGLAFIERHPADYALYDLLGQAYADVGPAAATEALAFANRALFLHPWDGRAHRVAARALLVLGRRSQAFLEYRLAYEAGDPGAWRGEALERARTLEELQALTPGSVQAAEELLVALVGLGRREEALTWLAWARERFDAEPGVVRLWEHEARLRLGRGELALAEAASDEVSRRAPEVLGTHLLSAEVLWAQGRREAALHSLEALRARFPGSVELAFALARLQLAAGLTRRARETLEQVKPFLTELGQRVHLFSLEGDSYEREGRLARALDSWQLVVRMHPTGEGWYKVARLREALHRHDAAARAVREGLRLLPPERQAEGEAWVGRLEEAGRQRMEQQRHEQLGGSEETDTLLRVLGSEEAREEEE
jgi:tetratricopeptide (TPR) repeat protein